MKIYAFFMLLGCFFTLLIPETKRITLEQLAGEDTDTASRLAPIPESEKQDPLASNGSDKAAA